MSGCCYEVASFIAPSDRCSVRQVPARWRGCGLYRASSLFIPIVFQVMRLDFSDGLHRMCVWWTLTCIFQGDFISTLLRTINVTRILPRGLGSGSVRVPGGGRRGGRGRMSAEQR